VAIVLDRVPPEAMQEVRTHLASMLRDRGLTSSPLFTVPETVVDDDGMLDPEVVRPVRSWLVALARDSQARQVVVRRTLTGALTALRGRLAELVEAAQAELAARDAWQRWRSVDGGRALAAQHPALAAPAPGLQERAARTVRDWQGYVLELVASEGGDRRATARALSFGVNGIGVLLMLVVFSQCLGLSGAEVGIAGGTAVLAQRLLEAVFGDQAVRTLAAKAEAELMRRSQVMLDVDRRRFTDVIAGLDVGTDVETLRALQRHLEAGR
jgi:hypothetical protein